MHPISAIARKFKLSRSTLLYYDRLGLVRPSYRTAAGYRLYQAEDLKKLTKVCKYREAGLSLREIASILDPEHSERSTVRAALHRRLSQLNGEIAVLRKQQQTVISLLKTGTADQLARAMTKQKWIALLRSAGLSDQEMGDWHAAFEHQTPEAHQDFLESLGIEKEEIEQIRKRSHERALSLFGNQTQAN